MLHGAARRRVRRLEVRRGVVAGDERVRGGGRRPARAVLLHLGVEDLDREVLVGEKVELVLGDEGLVDAVVQADDVDVVVIEELDVILARRPDAHQSRHIVGVGERGGGREPHRQQRDHEEFQRAFHDQASFKETATGSAGRAPTHRHDLPDRNVTQVPPPAGFAPDLCRSVGAIRMRARIYTKRSVTSASTNGGTPPPAPPPPPPPTADAMRPRGRRRMRRRPRPRTLASSRPSRARRARGTQRARPRRAFLRNAGSSRARRIV